MTTIDLSSCTKKTSYFLKDCQKFKPATKMISRGSQQSSSQAYAVACGNLCNTHEYSPNDIVAISAEGRRTGRIAPDFDEILRAIESRVSMFITDSQNVRNTYYNLGEQEVARFLETHGYHDPNGAGHWHLAK
jgi:hypothetical protein